MPYVVVKLKGFDIFCFNSGFSVQHPKPLFEVFLESLHPQILFDLIEILTRGSPH